MKLARRVLACSVVLLGASPAFANDHFARVNEVMLSFGGDNTKQFIEIEDTAAEAFAGGGYVLFVYGADGTTQAHSQPLALATGTNRITLASPTAFTQFGLATKTTPPDLILNLGDSLPAAGTICFRKSGVDLHCLAYGQVTAPTQSPTNGKLAGPAPTDGMSLQRQASGTCGGVGAPTVNAANATLTCVDPPMSGSDAGPGGDAGVDPFEDDDGCSVHGKGSWFGLVAAVLPIAIKRAVRRSRRRLA